MKRTLQGRYETISTVGEKARAFIPSDLPPSPPIVWTPALRERFDNALLALGRLDSVSALLPDTALSRNEHGDIRRRDPFDHLHDFAHLDGVADDAVFFLETPGCYVHCCV